MSKKKDQLKKDTPKYPNQKIKLTVDIPPSKNHAFFYRRGAKIAKAGTRRYMENVQAYVKEEIKKQNWQKDLGSVWYYADLYFYYPDKRIRDSHNCIEILMDSLEKVLFPNDYYVMPRVQSVQLDRKNPRMEMIFYAK